MFVKAIACSVLSIVCVGCDTNTSIVCDKVSECHLEVTRRVNGVDVPVDSCKEELGADDDCAECVDEHTCAEIAAGGCSCGPFDFGW